MGGPSQKERTVSGESITIVAAIVATGIGLATLILTTTGRLGVRLTAVETAITEIRERLARLEGQVDVLARFLIDRDRGREPSP